MNNVYKNCIEMYSLGEWVITFNGLSVLSRSIYSISQEICTRFCCALFCCGYAIVHNEFTWSIYPYSSGCFAGTGAIVRLPQCQWSKPDGYGKISQCITTTKHSKAKTCAYFLGYTVHCVIFLAWKYTVQDLLCKALDMDISVDYKTIILGKENKEIKLWCY